MEERTVIEWEKNDLETLRLLKVDVLVGAPAGKTKKIAGPVISTSPLEVDGSRHASRKTIEKIATYLGLPARAFVKSLVVVPEGGGEAGALFDLDHLPAMGSGRRRPEASGAPSAMRWNSTPVILMISRCRGSTTRALSSPARSRWRNASQAEGSRSGNSFAASVSSSGTVMKN